MESINVRKATENGIKALTRKMEKLLEDQNDKFYQDNVVKFGIPEEYVKKAFSEAAIVDSVQSEKATFYLALKKREIRGFAQVVRHGSSIVELDRIVVFPEYERMGIGTKMLKRANCRPKEKWG